MMENDATNRLVTLDALRGFAVMGILAMNIVAFAMPEWAYISPSGYGPLGTSEIISWAASFLIFDGKMRGLFSILFGASLLLITDRAEAKGESAAGVHFRRMAWLALFGLAHFFFIWFGDILFLYASVGCIAFLFRKWQPRRLIKWALILFAGGTLIWGGIYASALVFVTQGEAPGASAEMVKGAKDVRAQFAKIEQQSLKEVTQHRQGFVAIAREKLTNRASAPFMGVVQSLLETLPLMMLGMAMFRNGFLTGEWEGARYRKWIWRLLPGGIILTGLCAWVQYATNFDKLVTINAFLAWAGPGRLMMTIAYAAMLVLLVRRLAGTELLARVTATGRAAFTNYLGTSIAMTFIFYGWGLGYFGYVSRASLYLFVLGAWAVMLLWSKPWLERFHYGPFEWVWRSLARGTMQPMRR
ncbi:MAG: hypothetical protein RLZZ58_835 [Pseudomonadota bacterium]